MPKQNKDLLEAIWHCLKETKHVSLRFRAGNKWKGEGSGEVIVSYDGNAACTFQERGSWRSIEDQEFTFRNVFRWTMNRLEGMLMLEHLRFGEKNPVFLLQLAPGGEKTLESLDAHLCGNDTYFGQLTLEPTALELYWRILGPKKNDEVRYRYTSSIWEC